MPCALGHVGVGAREQHAEVGEVRPRGPHLLAGDDPLVAVALGPRRERREVGARARLAEQLAPHLLVAHDRRQEAQPLLLGAVREQRGRGEVEAERVEPAEVERRAARLDARARPRAAGRARRTRPATSARRARRARTPGTRPRTRRACAPRGSPPRRRRRPASIHARGTLRVDPRAHRVDRVGLAVSGVDREPRRRSRSSPFEVGRSRFSRNAARPSRKSSLRDDSSSANASLRELLRRATRSRPACSSHFVEPERDRRAGRRAVPTSSSTAASSSAAGTARVDRAPRRGLGAARARGRAAAARAPAPRRRGAAAARSRRCRG